ncbi:MAG: sigma-54-dependent Fis family transcriptional regulator [Alphaproteobacteria bacterium]|nr:sigma-54-dependent Fis family transcriptional regulator [Alphaproteobacteria bacterium]
MTTKDILIVDDEADIRALIRGILEDEGYTVREAGGSKEAFAAIEEAVPALVIQDIWLQDSHMDGLEILREIKSKQRSLPFVMISGHGTIETAVSAIKDGAYDFIEKPFKSDRLLMMVSRALENASLLRENAALKKQNLTFEDDLIGQSSEIQNIKQVIEKAAPTNSRILIQGEAGTGKGVIARLIHKYSLRADQVLVTLNCATLNAHDFEVELFGCAKDSEQIGVFEQAQGGTLILDEVTDLPIEAQSKIIRVLQEKTFKRVGDTKNMNIDIRVIATSGRDIEEAVQSGAFKDDLYYRLNVVPISMPALKERSEDIPALAEHFVRELQNMTDEEVFTKAALRRLKSYTWPGNVRQLKNVIEWMCIMHSLEDGECFDVQHLPPEITGVNGENGAGQSPILQELNDMYLEIPLRDARELFEKEYLLTQVDRFEGNISQTAKFVGMERSALHRKLKSLNIGSTDEKPAEETKADVTELDTASTRKKRA